MMHWTMIILLLAGMGSGGAATGKLGFETEQLCKDAEKQLHDKNKGSWLVTQCVRVFRKVNDADDR